eukprot:7379561-Prymnesium_polylepis.1
MPPAALFPGRAVPPPSTDRAACVCLPRTAAAEHPAIARGRAAAQAGGEPRGGRAPRPQD